MLNYSALEEVTAEVKYNNQVNIDNEIDVCREMADGDILEEVLKKNNPTMLIRKLSVITATEAANTIDDIRKFVEAEVNVTHWFLSLLLSY